MFLKKLVSKHEKEDKEEGYGKGFVLNCASMVDLGAFLFKLNPLGRARITGIESLWDYQQTIYPARAVFRIIREECRNLRSFVLEVDVARLRQEGAMEGASIVGMEELRDLKRVLKRRSGCFVSIDEVNSDMAFAEMIA
jgi:hypothetical protein